MKFGVRYYPKQQSGMAFYPVIRIKKYQINKTYNQLVFSELHNTKQYHYFPLLFLFLDINIIYLLLVCYYFYISGANRDSFYFSNIQ